MGGFLHSPGPWVHEWGTKEVVIQGSQAWSPANVTADVSSHVLRRKSTLGLNSFID